MNSIPQSDGTRKRVQVIRGGLGYVIKGQGIDKYHGVALPKRARGDIKGFSNGSARRLRETLALAKHDGEIFGFTLTIPGKVLPTSQVRRLWHGFMLQYKRNHKCPMVWRIELQKRKQAHWHCVAWIHHPLALAEAINIGQLWRRVVRNHVGALPRKTDIGFDLHGVDIKVLKGATPTGMIDYLCDHASKHKREQLGWRGRQWGVINRSALDFEGEMVADVSSAQHMLAARQFRRLQEHLRRDGVYTGGKVTPSGEIMHSVFGRDAARLLRCYEAVRKGVIA